jgi:biopolymer transport protein ExbB/TolQ
MHPSDGLLRQMAEESVQEQCFALMRKAEWCGLIGNVAPMVGLFGTVYGMIQAFNILGISSGQPAPGQLAGSISVALVTTFWGLLVAIPALFLAGFFRTRVEGFASEAAVEVEALLERILDVSAAKAASADVSPVRLSEVVKTERPAAQRESAAGKPAIQEQTGAKR